MSGELQVPIDDSNSLSSLKSIQEISNSIGNQVSNNLNIHALQDVSKSISKHVAALFLGAVVFTVAMSWNNTMTSIINIWAPDDAKDSSMKKVTYNFIASLILTVAAVIIAAILTHIYWKSIRGGQATYYGLIG